MTIYLYRAVALEPVDHPPTGEPIFWPGMPLGRATGYLSRSSAVHAGQRALVRFKILRSEPVTFHLDAEIRTAIETDELRERVAELESELASSRAIRSRWAVAS